MHRIAIALCLGMSVAACAHRPIPVENGFETTAPAPLAVRLLPPQDGTLRFLTSEPAYVAIFEIVPDFGISMLYPRSGEPRVSAAGLNTTFMPSYVTGRSYYENAPYYFAVSSFRKPKYLYVIASRSPLPVADILVSPQSLRQTLGWRWFVANDLSGTLDAIERLVAGSLPEDEWSSDLYVIWPDVPSDLPWHAQYAFLACDDGRMVLVPLSWNVPACPGTRNLAQATKPSTPPGIIPEPDTTGAPEVPGRAGGGIKRGGPARPVDRIPGDSPIARLGDLEQAERRPPVREPYRPPEGRPAPGPAPAQNPPRTEPPRAEPPRSEPPRSEPPRAEPRQRDPAPAPSPSEPAERRPAEKP